MAQATSALKVDEECGSMIHLDNSSPLLRPVSQSNLMATTTLGSKGSFTPPQVVALSQRRISEKISSFNVKREGRKKQQSSGTRVMTQEQEEWCSVQLPSQDGQLMETKKPKNSTLSTVSTGHSLAHSLQLPSQNGQLTKEMKKKNSIQSTLSSGHSLTHSSQLPSQNGQSTKETKKNNNTLSTVSPWHSLAHRPFQTREILPCTKTFTSVSSGKINHFVNVSGNISKYPSSFNNKKSSSDRKRQTGGSFQKFSTSPLKMATRDQPGSSFLVDDEGSKDFLDCNEEGDKYQHAWCGSSQQNANLQGSKNMQNFVDVTALSSGKIKIPPKSSRSGIEFGSVCDSCGAVAVTNDGWDAHQRAHRKKNTSCKHCCSVFLTAYGCDLHQKLHIERQTSQVDDFCNCALCGGSFISIVYLELHLSEMHGPDALYDSQSFVLGSSPTPHPAHLYEAQSREQLFRCGVCYAKFTYSFNLDCHMALHTQISYACGLCDSMYTSLNLLVSHCKDHLSNVTTAAPLHGAPLGVESTCMSEPRRSQLPGRSYDDMWEAYSGNFLHTNASPFSDPVSTPELFTTGVSTPQTYRLYNSNKASTTATNSALKSNSTTAPMSASNCSDAKASRFAMASDPYSAISETTASSGYNKASSSTAFKTEDSVILPRGLGTALYPEISSSTTDASSTYNTSNSATVKTEEPDSSQWGLDANHPQLPSITNFLLMMPLLTGKDPRTLNTHLPMWQDTTSTTTDSYNGYFNPYLLNE